MSRPSVFNPVEVRLGVLIREIRVGVEIEKFLMENPSKEDVKERIRGLWRVADGHKALMRQLPRNCDVARRFGHQLATIYAELSKLRTIHHN